MNADRCPRCGGKLYADEDDASCISCGFTVYSTEPLPLLGGDTGRKPSRRTVRNESYRGTPLAEQERRDLYDES